MANTSQGYQPKTGAKCSCKRGVERDNCANCEGTGFVIDFRAIRARNAKQTERGAASLFIELSDGNITVKHGTDGETQIFEV